MLPRSDHPVYQETYYDDAAVTIRLSPINSDYLTGAVLVIGGALLGRIVIPYDYQLLEVLVIVACYIVASRRDEKGE